MKYILGLLVWVVSLTALAQLSDRWIIETSHDELPNGQSLEQVLKSVCPQIDIKTNQKMGLKKHYVITLSKPLGDLSCLTKSALIKRVERDRMMQPMAMPQKLN